jgi:glycosyltransferase involved in cell wall biosynthesis
MKKVCILTSVHPSLDHRIFHKQAKSLVKAGYDVTLIAQHERDEVVDGIKIIALPEPKSRFRRILGTRRLFRLARKQKADIYHFHDPELLLWGWLLQRLSHKPVIYDVHENLIKTIPFKPWIPRLLRKPIAWFADIVERTLAGRLAAIITISESMQQRFAGCRGICISVCNFPDLRMISEALASQKHDSATKRYSVIHNGKMSQERGFKIILGAMDLVIKQRPGAVCAILGDTKSHSWLDQESLGLMNRLIKQGNLQIIGRVPHHEVFRYLEASSIGWKPRLHYQDALDVTVFEYMACGMPIVASDVPLINDIVRESKCGILVEPDNTKAHASAILYLLEHPDEAQKMGEKGKSAVRRWYNWETEAKKLRDVYSKLLGEDNV